MCGYSFLQGSFLITKQYVGLGTISRWKHEVHVRVLCLVVLMTIEKEQVGGEDRCASG